MDRPTNLPEARASVSYTVYTPNGYSTIFTVRSDDEGELLDLMVDLEAHFDKHGYSAKGGKSTPVSKAGFVRSNEGGDKPLQGEPSTTNIPNECPKCGQPLVEFEAKGNKAFKCSTSKWDPDTKTQSGCDFFMYADDKPATAAQVELLKDKGLWKEGMTKSIATAVISKSLAK